VQELASVLQSMIDIRDKAQEENQQLAARCAALSQRNFNAITWLFNAITWLKTGESRNHKSF
jgi:hypothetical protein